MLPNLQKAACFSRQSLNFMKSHYQTLHVIYQFFLGAAGFLVCSLWLFYMESKELITGKSIKCQNEHHFMKIFTN